MVLGVSLTAARPLALCLLGDSRLPPITGGTPLTPLTYWREGGLHQPLIEDRSGGPLRPRPWGSTWGGWGCAMQGPLHALPLPLYGSSLLHSMKTGAPHRPSHSDLRSPCFLGNSRLPPYHGGDTTHPSLARGWFPLALIEDRSGGPLRPRPRGGTWGGGAVQCKGLALQALSHSPHGSSLLHSLKAGAPPRPSHSSNGTSSSYPEGAPIANTMSEFARVRARHKA